MQISYRESLLATVLYSDVFHYPLTREECEYWLIKHKSRSGKHRIVKPLQILKRDGIPYVVWRQSNAVSSRLKREAWTREKEQYIQKALSLLHLLPTILLIGVTGGVAVNNAHKDDDIDLFFIVKNNTLFSTRLIVTLILEAFGLRRKRNQSRVANLICTNMFMTESALTMPESERDLFLAHEILQMKPVVDKGIYTKFLRANSWVNTFLPYAYSRQLYKHESSRFSSGFINKMFYVCFKIVDPVLKHLQLFYMKRHRTSEVITDDVLRFHPHDARVYVKKIYERKLKYFNIPLDKIFYDK